MDKKTAYELNQLAIAGKIQLTKTEKTDNGFYCGTWYKFATLDGQHIKTTYCPAGFGL